MDDLEQRSISLGTDPNFKKDTKVKEKDFRVLYYASIGIMMTVAPVIGYYAMGLSR